MPEKTKPDGANRRRSELIPRKPTLQITFFFHLCASLIFLSGVVLFLTWQIVYIKDPNFAEVQLEFANRIVWMISILFSVLGLVAFFLSVTFSARITGPMVAIHRMLDKLIEKDFSARVNLRTNDEFHDLATRLNELAETCQKSLQK